MPARPPREGQGSKHSWLPADNPLCWLPLQEPCREDKGSGEGNLPPGLPHRCHITLCCSKSRSPIGMQVAGQPEGSATQHCSHASKKHGQLENINLLPQWSLDRMQQPRGRPGSKVTWLHPR